MTADEAAFLRGIRETPDADLPRLVYADYLEEQGHPLRAEFLRAHLELDRRTEDSPRRRELAFWCRTQLDTQPHLLFEPPFQPKFARHGRGLIEAAEFWNASAEVIASAFELAPLRRVWVYGLDGLMSQLQAIPRDNCLRTLDLTGNRLHPSDLMNLDVILRGLNVKELVLTGCNLGDDAARVLCERRTFAEMEQLCVGKNPITASARTQFIEEFGDRLSLSMDRDPALLYAIRPCEGVAAGFGDGHVLLIGVLAHDGYRVGVFDFSGNILDFECGYQQTSEQATAELAAVLARRGYQPGTIHVKRFGWPSGGGLFDSAGLQTYPLSDAPGENLHTAEEMAEVHAFWQRWLRDGGCKLKWGYGDVWLNRDGDVISI